MKRKGLITLAAVAVLLIGIHYIAAEILSQRIKNAVTHELSKGNSDVVPVKEVSVQPFRGNIIFSNLNLNNGSDRPHLRMQSLSTNLSYRQLWSLYFKDTSTFLKTLESINLSGYHSTVVYPPFTIISGSAKIQIIPLDDDTLSQKSDPLTRFTRTATITFKMDNISIQKNRNDSASVADTLHFFPLHIKKLSAKANWNEVRKTLNLHHFKLMSSALNGDGTARWKWSRRTSTPRIASLRFSLSYSPSFRINFGPGKGSFTGRQLQWERTPPKSKAYNKIGTAIAGSKHTLSMAHFTWKPPQAFRDKLKAYTGGIGMTGKTIQGDSLNLAYHYNVDRHVLDLQQLSYTTPDYSVSTKGTFTIDPDQLSHSYIRNAEIKIFNLSEELKSSLQQLEQMFGIKIIEPTDQTIRLYLQGKLQSPEWKML